MKIVVTGANGYIGSHFSRHASGLGHTVIAATRKRLVQEGEGWCHFDLAENLRPDFPTEVDAIVHLAAHTTGASAELINQEKLVGEQLARYCQTHDFRLVFVSSQTAREDAPTVYGRSKWQIEQSVLNCGGIVVRPGQVYGGVPRGLFGTLVRTVQRFVFIPLPYPSPSLQLIHVEDLCHALLSVALSKQTYPKPVLLAGDSVESLSSLLGAIAKYRVRRFRVQLPVPAALIRFCMKLVGPSLSERFGLTRLMSLYGLRRMATHDDLASVGVACRALDDGMHVSGSSRRRMLLLEARTLMLYVLRAEPTIGQLKRYVRVTELLGKGVALGLPGWVARLPTGVSLFESGWQESQLLVERLNHATTIAEADRRSVPRFLAVEPFHWTGRIGKIITIVRGVILELFVRGARFMLGPLLRRNPKTK